MNQKYAGFLIFIFFIAVGAFNIANGIQNIRKRTQSTFWGWFRIILGIVMLLIPLPLFIFLRQGQQ